MNIIRELFYGNVGPDYFMEKRGTEYEKAIDIAIELEEKLGKMLNDEEKEILWQFMRAHDDIQGIDCCESFYDGWKLGARFVIDTFMIT